MFASEITKPQMKSCGCATNSPVRQAATPFAQDERMAKAGRWGQPAPGNQARLRLLARRPASTDDLGVTDLSVPRANDAGPVDAGVPGGAPGAPEPAPEPSCCDKAFTKGLASTDVGGVVCCNNVKHSCVWPSNISSVLTNAKARSISMSCVIAHEDTHHDDIDCTGAALERPNFKAGKNAKAEECIAYTTEVACFDAHLPECGDDSECKTQLQARRTMKQGQAAGMCA